MGRQWLVGAVLCLVVVVLSASASTAEAQVAAGSALDGKVIVVYLKSDPKAGAVLESVQVQMLGDRAFLVGSGADLGDASRAGLIQWIPVDDIGRIHEFKDINELRARTRQGA